MNITIQIPFAGWTGKPALSIEIDATIEARFHMRTAVMKAVSKSANLSGANLSGADLRSVNVRSADLSGADLRSADLSGADLRSADLSGADLRSANLRSVNLSGADLRSANLRSVNLSGANLRSADLSGAVSAELACAMTSITPEGTFIGWKKCNDGVIVAMLIPVAAKRCNATGRKCRAEYVEVLEVYGATEGTTDRHGPKTVYRKGETVKCHEWDSDRFNECSGGIHFFLTRIEAENY